ncbi:MAG: cytidylyltransferase domain-containing protein [Thermoplasmatota archaeon]
MGGPRAARPRVVGIIQARFGSRRLPGKVLAQVGGETVLARLVARLLSSECVSEWWIATSTEPSDDKVSLEAARIGVRCHRGSLDDVLARFHDCALRAKADHIVRITGDCPFQYGKNVDELVRFYFEGNYDYCSNALDPTLPDGLDAEIMRFGALQAAFDLAKKPSEREHVTPFLYGHPEMFHVGSLRYERDLSALRWTLDEPEDLDLVRRVFGALLPRAATFGMEDVLQVMEEHPEWKEINRRHQRNEGYLASLAAEEAASHET